MEQNNIYLDNGYKEDARYERSTVHQVLRCQSILINILKKLDYFTFDKKKSFRETQKW